jgi:hypothetical protein
VNPNISAALNVVIAVVGAVAALKPDMFPGYIASTEAGDIIKTAGIMAIVLGAINSGLHVTAPSQRGFLGK